MKGVRNLLKYTPFMSYAERERKDEWTIPMKRPIQLDELIRKRLGTDSEQNPEEIPEGKYSIVGSAPKIGHRIDDLAEQKDAGTATLPV